MRAIVLATVLSACATGGRAWTARDGLLEAGFAGSMALDYMQTERITGICMESNPIMGRCGQRVSPKLYFPLAALLHLGVTAALPRGWARTTFQGVSLGLEGAVVVYNWRSGVAP